MQLQDRTRRLTVLALLAAAAFVLSWLDSQIPLTGMLPGAKLGLGNLAVLSGIYLLGPGPASILCILKILLSTLLFGNAYSFFYSMAGGLLSFLGMLLARKQCSVMFVSVLGGMLHNLGQIAVAAVILETAGLWGYFPVLLLCGIGAGLAVGTVGGILIQRMKRILPFLLSK